MDTNTTIDRNMRLQGKRSRWPEALAVLIVLALAVWFVVSQANHTSFLGMHTASTPFSSMFH